MAENEKIELQTENISTENIFSDFENDSALQDDIKKQEEEIEKDVFYYLSKVASVLKYINIVAILVLIIAFVYIFIQNDTESRFDDAGFLQIACPVIVGDSSMLENGSCSPIQSMINKYTQKKQELKETTLEKTLVTMKEAYAIQDLINSDKVSFVLDKTQNKQDLFSILSAFDKLKNKFLTIDKKQIECSNIIIKGNEFSASCSSYSASWESNIPGFDGSKSASATVEGTSISIASSFLNYLELDKNISLISKQKIFTQQQVFMPPYISKTDFDVRFIYKTNSLNF